MPPFSADCLADQLGKGKDEVTSWTPYPGGAPANVATGVARLGLHAIFLTALGKDDLGDGFLKLLKGAYHQRQRIKYSVHTVTLRRNIYARGWIVAECIASPFADRNVDTAYVQRNDHPTRDVLVTRSMDGDRTFAGFGAARTEEYADCFVDAAALPQEVIASADALVTGTLGLAYPGSGSAIRKAIDAAKSGDKCTVVIDVNWRPVFWSDVDAAKKVVREFVPRADILKVTDEEAEWLFGIPAADALSHPEQVLGAVPSASGVLVSAGEKGSAYAFRTSGSKMDVTGIVPVLDVKVVDTTGAGDAYLSGFIFYMLMSGGLAELVADPDKVRRAVQFATACGAATCLRPGAIDAQPTVAVAESLLNEAGWNI